MQLNFTPDHSLQAETLYGETYRKKDSADLFVKQSSLAKEHMTSYTDPKGGVWQTDEEGKDLHVTHPQKDVRTLNLQLRVFKDYVIRVIYVERNGTTGWEEILALFQWFLIKQMQHLHMLLAYF